ncbi:MAG: hypothetical protein E7676_03160 [Ruminococcaceae bacterium]|nr:hypothetical protein [Oscillospiraceae bacterium]
MEEKSMAEKECYFGAANTYHGFKSYFPEIFSPADYSRLYVIKGGPGTGKSSMMKQISSHFLKKGCTVEEIFCSSDPKSLDGVVVKNGDKKIAVIDGTAPHETDAKIPGAIDEILNLGDMWDTRWLSSKRTEICELNKEKSEAYKTAYSYLKIAGKAFDFIMSLARDSFDFCKARKKIIEFCHEFNSENCNRDQIRLISAFGKNGSIKLETLENKSKKLVKISGDEFPVFLFLNELSNILFALNITAIRFPNALNPEFLDAICLEESSMTIMAGDGGNINVDEMIKGGYEYNSERIKNASYIREISLAEAKRWFGIASDMHFRLEAIYSVAMDFEKINELLSLKLSEMENILEV